MASLRARHSLRCALSAGLKVGRETTAPKGEGGAIEVNGVHCTCKPVYSIRGGAGQGHDRVGRDLREALRRLRKRQTQEDDGALVPIDNLRFATWAERWLSELERDQTTKAAYKSTITYATEVFGKVTVRKVTPAHISGLNRRLREAKLSDSTRAKHLRVLGSCFASAIEHHYAAQNPVKALPRAEKPRPTRREAAYFETAELPKLFARVPEGLWQTLFLTALKTGMREGELAGLTWGDVDLTGGHIYVRRSYSGGRLGETKSRQWRTVDVSADVVELLGGWWGAAGKPDDDALVFPYETGGYIPEPRTMLKVLYAAMRTAELPREGPTGEKRTFHSFRHTFAKTALENGRPITWVSRQLGHSSIVITDTVYGHFERKAAKREAAKMQGVFGV